MNLLISRQHNERPFGAFPTTYRETIIMFTVETEDNHTKVVALDASGKHEDIEMYIEDNGRVFIRQWAEDLKEYQVLILSFNQFLSLMSCIDSEDGMFTVEIGAKGTKQ